MVLNEFSQNHFAPNDDKQHQLMEQLKEHLTKFGMHDRAYIMKALERTKPFTRTVYPQGWKQ